VKRCEVQPAKGGAVRVGAARGGAARGCATRGGATPPTPPLEPPQARAAAPACSCGADVRPGRATAVRPACDQRAISVRSACDRRAIGVRERRANAVRPAEPAVRPALRPAMRPLVRPAMRRHATIARPLLCEDCGRCTGLNVFGERWGTSPTAQPDCGKGVS
jgi:hypothetical protein